MYIFRLLNCACFKTGIVIKPTLFVKTDMLYEQKTTYAGGATVCITNIERFGKKRASKCINAKAGA
ncbi:hypothetical protein PES01_09880 [Pseudoalteromonas espejiana]|uniref:Uncharacterized protein n=1 Tax=Pseudoalteromonas espejiana TaxID=28107 RepID=A0A510XT06_9GAMM|nr:hypothetical protein PES01_09880 [Pseudoalteromonas espejiana]